MREPEPDEAWPKPSKPGPARARTTLVASSLTGPYEFVQTGDFAGWGQLEGPCVTRLDDGTFRLFADGYSTSKYVYTDSSDLYNWTATTNLPGGLSGFVRHGTVLNQ